MADVEEVIDRGLFFDKLEDARGGFYFVLGLKMTFKVWIQYDQSHSERITQLPLVDVELQPPMDCF